MGAIGSHKNERPAQRPAEKSASRLKLAKEIQFRFGYAQAEHLITVNAGVKGIGLRLRPQRKMTRIDGVQMRLQQELFASCRRPRSNDQIALLETVENLALVLDVKSSLLAKIRKISGRLLISAARRGIQSNQTPTLVDELGGANAQENSATDFSMISRATSISFEVSIAGNKNRMR